MESRPISKASTKTLETELHDFEQETLSIERIILNLSKLYLALGFVYIIIAFFTIEDIIDSFDEEYDDWKKIKPILFFFCYLIVAIIYILISTVSHKVTQ